MKEQWLPIKDFDDYSVSDHGRIRSDKSDRIMSVSANQFGVYQVGLMKDGVQYHRSVPLLVARAFLPIKPGPFDTPINLDGNRAYNGLNNLVWRPRWFAVKYNRQFRHPYHNRIEFPIKDIKTGRVSANSFECAKEYGLLEEDVVLTILNRTYTWPTYQTFTVLDR